MLRRFVAAILLSALAFSIVPEAAQAAASSDSIFSIFKPRKRIVVLREGVPVKARKTPKVLAKKKAARVDVALSEPIRIRPRRISSCGGFTECLFGPSRRSLRITRDTRRQVASLSRPGLSLFGGPKLSTRQSRRTVEWNETRYAPGSLVVKTPERALYYVLGDGEALRYSVGVGKEGMQWSGTNRISRKAEWPGWTPPQEMIEREAEKGRILPEFMEGGPGNPLGARALYIGSSIYRIHGTNNEASIGGAVSSGCIRMMNADVIDLYDRVKVGSKVYVYQ
jgi:lipoprotein-anchoring transpeptidase ErfK/SrfK